MGTSIGRRAARAAGTTTPTGDWRSGLARFGLVAKGAFYLSLGLLAVQFAEGDAAAEDASPAGAIEQVARQPFGQLLLIVLTLGLFSLTIWHIAQALTGDPVEGDDATDRAKYAGKAVSYASISTIAVSVLAANWGKSSPSAGGGGGGEERATAAVLDWPAGQWLVGAAGLAVIGIGLYALVRYALGAGFMERLDRSRLRGSLAAAVEAAGRIGYGARGVVFAIIGGLLVVAAVRHQPDEAGGISEALATLADRPWGQALLWVVAAGLGLYGLFSLAEARYRRAA